MGIISKKYIEDINKSVLNSIKVNQWKNSSAVINWFENLKVNVKSRFIKFDIVDFYPSISEHLLEKSIMFARSHIEIDNKIIQVIKLSRKSLLFNESSTCGKIGYILFDATLGSFDGAEMCELGVLYLNLIFLQLGKICSSMKTIEV